MESRSQLYIGGSWRDPQGTSSIEVIDAATEEVFGSVPAGRLPVPRMISVVRAYTKKR